MKYECAEPPQEMRGTWVDDGHGNYHGECVSLVKRQCAELPETKRWVKGAPVKNNANIKAGTPIATFAENGTYEGHAAIYISQDGKGIWVWDQWKNAKNPKGVSRRLIEFNDKKPRQNNGNAYYVVE